MDTTIENFDWSGDDLPKRSLVKVLAEMRNQIEYLSTKEPISEQVFIAGRTWFTYIELKFIDLPPLMKTKTRLVVKMSWLANRLLWQIMAQ